MVFLYDTEKILVTLFFLPYSRFINTHGHEEHVVEYDFSRCLALVILL